MSNKTKSISDEKMSCVQYQNRKENHPTEISKTKVRFKPGDNVFVKSDKNKLKGREMYKVVEVFNKNDEDWAKLQKSETQFRSKEYLVKCAEILHVPVPTIIEDDEVHLQENSSHDTQHNKADDTSTEVLEPQLNDDTNEDVYDTVQKEADREPEEKIVNNSQYERPRRKAAIRNKNSVKEMISAGVLKTNRTNVPKPPTHAWDWSTFRDLVDAEDDITIVGFMADPHTDNMTGKEDSHEGCSPVANAAPPSPIQISTDPLRFSDADSEQEEYTLDTPRRSLRLMGDQINWATYDAFGRK